MPMKYDIVITGSGFAGSIAALALHQSGKRVLLLEKGRHPRFTIGESSTPIADMILRSLAQRYRLPVLERLSRYGSWQKHHPGIGCGLKRGFSYFMHRPGELFSTDRDHSRELIAAASSSDQNSDTNWFRADLDAFLVDECVRAGIEYRDRTEIVSVGRSGKVLELKLATGSVRCDWLIDATGSPRQACTLLGAHLVTEGFQTRSRALFSHFENVPLWSDHLRELGISDRDYPINPDHSALHHWLEEGWMWNLRFNNGRTSAGFMIDLFQAADDSSDPQTLWQKLTGRYPSLFEAFGNAGLAPQPGRIILTGRLQRRLDRLYGENWIALNHTAGFIDPLHSTGIAHSLCGLERVLEILLSDRSRDRGWVSDALEEHQRVTFKEMELIDLLVASCYRSRWHLPLFRAAIMLYFIGTIRYENLRLAGSPPRSYLCADHEPLFELIRQTFQEISALHNVKDQEKAHALAEQIRERIAPWNTAGLLDPDKRNMYHHTAVTL